MNRDRKSDSRSMHEEILSEPIGQGILLEGKYRLHEQLGRGGMGTVFRAIDELLDREVAVKFLNPQYQSDPAFSERFAQEARSLASVRHPNVLEVFSFGTYGLTPFFVMEYIRGMTMADVVRLGVQSGQDMLLDEVIGVVSQACAGLGAVHRADVVHRDIKPANLMIQTSSKRIVLMDFGLGVRWKPTQPRIESWIPGGTPAYMAPEMFLERRLDMWEARLADIYSLGVTAYVLLTGVNPFDGGTWVEIMRRHVKLEPPWPSMVRSDLPPALDPVVMRCIAKSPSMRYQHCEELAQALLPFIHQGGKQSSRDFVISQRDLAPPAIKARTPSPPSPEPPAKVDTESARKLANLRAHPHFLAIKRSGVLVADPDPSFRTRVLEAAEAVLPGCRFHAARTNTSALDLARKSPPAILIAGVNDARLNGLELTAMIQGDDRLKGIQVVLTADKITNQDKAILSRMGVCKTVIKTSEGNELKSAIFAATSASLALAFKTSGA